MAVDNSFIITDTKTTTPLRHKELVERYKIYARQVTGIDLSGRGGWALPGNMLKVFSNVLVNDITVAMPKETEYPVVVCIDKRDPSQDADGNPLAAVAGFTWKGNPAWQSRSQPVTLRFGILFVPFTKLNMPKILMSGRMTGSPPVFPAHEEITVECGDFPGYVCVAAYQEPGIRTICIDKITDSLSSDYNRNPYYCIAKDLDALIKAKVLKFPNPSEKPLPDQLNASLKEEMSIHENVDLTSWLPNSVRFMGEIGGIQLFQNRLNPYGQPMFLAEVLLGIHPDEIKPEELEELLSLAQDQSGRFLGMQGQFGMLVSVLEAAIKKRDAMGGGH